MAGLVKTSQVNLDQVKLSQDMSRGGSNQVIAGQVKLGLVMSQTGSRKFFGPETKMFWTQYFFGTNIFLVQKCTGEWSLTLALAQLVNNFFVKTGFTE